MRGLGPRRRAGVDMTDATNAKPADTVAAEPAIHTAREQRAEFKAQQERESTARLNFSATKWERLPSLAFVGNYGSIGPAPDNAIPTRTYGVSIRVPLFDGGRRDARRAESQAQYRQEQIRTSDLREQIELDIRTALESLRSAEAQVAAARGGMDLAEQELTQAPRRYEAGGGRSIACTDTRTR